MKKGFVALNNGARLDLIPGENGSAKLAYIRFESMDGKYQGSIERLPELKRIRKWVNEMIKARKRK